jgi:hypothetical protein
LFHQAIDMVPRHQTLSGARRHCFYARQKWYGDARIAARQKAVHGVYTECMWLRKDVEVT